MDSNSKVGRVPIINKPLDFSHILATFQLLLKTVVKKINREEKNLPGTYLHLCIWSKNSRVTIWVL